MKIIILTTIIILVAVSGFYFLNKPQPQIQIPPSPTSIPTIKNEQINIKASFTIITGSITRNFKSEKYHNQSADVYISASDPTIIHVKKEGITWNDFFQTLPMKLTKDCLITGDGETLCTGEEGTLKFYLEEVETPGLLNQEIKEGDKALIKFS